MKKFYPFRVLLSVLGTCSLLLSSCSSSDDNDTPPVKIPANTFAYGDAQSKIESVVYTVDEQKVYTFYFSPTRGLVDLEAMLMADDYMKIVTSTPTGEIDLLSANNRLIYKNVDVSSETVEKVETATLSLQLTSLTTLKMTLGAAMSSGESLLAQYEGVCTKHVGQGEPGKDDYDVTLTDQIFGYYRGPAESAGTNEYYMSLTNAKWELKGGTQFTVKSEGFVLMLDFYGTTGENWRDMPTGTFTESAKFGDHTYCSSYSFLSYYNADGQRTDYQLVDAVMIERDETGNGTVTATYLDADYEEHKLIYTGAMKMADATLNVQLPQLDRDITIEGAYASGVYNGDIMENGTGLTEITIYDQKAEDDEPNASAMKIAVFAEKFTDPLRDRRLIPGTYKAATTFEQFTWMPPVEMNYMGTIIPLGTYALYADGSQTGLYAYAASGDIVIRAGSVKNNYTIEFELRTIAGYAIRGSYTGEVYLEDQSKDETNDGTSSLTNDYELNFDYLSKHNVNRAECYPQSEIWIRGLNTIPVSEAWKYSDGREYGFQHIVIGREVYEYTDEYPADKGKGKLVEGDVLGIDLLVEKGNEEKLATGTYSITPNRYPGYFYPGVCVCGYNCYYGTSMTFKTSAIGQGYPSGYYDPEYKVRDGWLNIPTYGAFASIYSGSVTVQKADGGDNWYTIALDGRDVLKHRITGTWTGPVYLGGTDTPVVQPATAIQTAAKQSAPSYREAGPAIREQLRRMPVRHSYKR